jgi:hypothetical protein
LPVAGMILAPEYTGLRAMSMLFNVTGLVAFAGAVVCMIIAVVNSSDPEREPLVVDAFVATIAFIVIGILYCGIGTFLTAFRDLVRNSFRK